jgi:hypothetical protein
MMPAINIIRENRSAFDATANDVVAGLRTRLFLLFPA